MDGEGIDGNSVGDNVSMGSDFSDSLTELRAGGRNYFGGRSVSCRIYNCLLFSNHFFAYHLINFKRSNNFYNF